MTSRLPYNPRVVSAPGDPALAAEIERFVGAGPAVGDWFLKLEGLGLAEADELRGASIRHGGGLLPNLRGEERADAILRIPADCVPAFLDAIEPTLAGPAKAIRETFDAWLRETFSLRCGGESLELGRRTLVMGIVNVTPDSFSDGGQFADPAVAIEHGRRLAAEGADILDIGGESTRPGAEPVDAETECRRVLPVIEALAREFQVPISIDTAKAAVARRAFDAGARILNDVTALRGDPEMARFAAEAGAPVVLMHMQGTPRTMQKDPHYDDLMGEIVGYLRQSMARAVEAGVAEDQLIVDPGIGFGKTLDHNLEIIRRLPELRSLGRPILLGTSRKKFIGTILDAAVDERLLGTAATVAFGIARGAHIVRVHDVAAMRQVARMTDALAGRQWTVGSGQ